MSEPERAGECRRGGGRAESGNGDREVAPRRETAGDPRREARGGRSEGRPHEHPHGGDSHPRSAQLIFVTSFGIPIGPSVREERPIPDDLDDSLPPGDLPGQLLLDLGLG